MSDLLFLGISSPVCGLEVPEALPVVIETSLSSPLRFQDASVPSVPCGCRQRRGCPVGRSNASILSRVMVVLVVSETTLPAAVTVCDIHRFVQARLVSPSDVPEPATRFELGDAVSRRQREK